MTKNIAILTSSRADYGILKPLISKLQIDNRFNISIIVFGMHLEEKFGYTVKEIKKDFKNRVIELKSMPTDDSKKEISVGFGVIIKKFNTIWEKHVFDFIIAIGDRFEMCAAVQSVIPYETKVVHIHGGETSLGSIDNIYRHQITLASSLHLTSNKFHSKRVEELLGNNNKKIINIGSLSLYGINKLKLPDWSDVATNFNLPLDNFIIATFHPETVNVDRNKRYAKIVEESFKILSKKVNIIFTSTNADTLGHLFNERILELSKSDSNIYFIKSLGKLNYFSALNSCLFVIGNSSSGIIEAASFKKYAINIGDRQLGRIKNNNVIDIDFDKKKIIEISNDLINKKSTFSGENIYEFNFKMNDLLNILYQF